MSGLLFIIGGVLTFLLVLVGLLYGVFFLSAKAIPDLLQSKTHARIRASLLALKENGFAPTMEYVGLGTAIAVDPKSKQVFLANNRAMKLYDVSQITRIETNIKSDQIVDTIRFTIRDLENPYYEVKQAINSKKLREIDSLLSIIREPAPSEARSTRPPISE